MSQLLSFSFIFLLASPLSEPPATPAADEPVTAEAPQEVLKTKRKIKEKKQIIDSVTELQDGPGAKVGRGRGGGLGAPMTKDVTNILTDQQFLPRSSVVMRLLAIRDDPLAHFLPTTVTNNGAFFCAAPPGLAPELSELFLRPLTGGLAPKRRGTSPDKSPNKRPRLDGTVDEDDIEQGRRAGSLAPSHTLGSDILGRHSVGPDGVIDFGDQTGTLDDYQLELPEFDLGTGGDMDIDRARSKSLAPSALSRLSTPTPDGAVIEEGDESYADASCPIAMFDVRPSTQTQTQGTEREADNQGKGYSKNTVKALGIIRKELQPVAGQEEMDKVLSFRKMSDKACFCYLSLRLYIHYFRHHAVPPRLSSSSCLSSEHAIVSSFHKKLLLRTSKSAPKINCGSNNDMGPLPPLVSALWRHPIENRLHRLTSEVRYAVHL